MADPTSWLRLVPRPDGRLEEPSSSLFREAIRSGAVFATPAENCYGLSCAFDNEKGIERIVALKGSRSGRSFVVAVGDEEQLGRIPFEADRRLISRLCEIWPAPLTVILPLRNPIAADASDRGSLAIRIPLDAALRELCLASGTPLVTTSANREGESPATSIPEVLAIWPSGLDGAVDDGSRIGGAVSTIVDLTTGNPRLIRPGSYPVDSEVLYRFFTPAAENSEES